MLGGCIYWWLLLFQEFDFEVVVKPCKHNVGLDHLSLNETWEDAQSLDDELMDVKLFRVESILDQSAKIT